MRGKTEDLKTQDARLERTWEGESSADLAEEKRRVVELVADTEAQEFLIEGALRGEQGDFEAVVSDFQSTGGGGEEEPGAFAVEFGLDEGTGVDGILDGEVRQGHGVEEADVAGEVVELAGLAGGEVGGFQTTGVVLAFRLAAGIGGGGVGVFRRAGQAVEAGAEFGADGIEQSVFHRAGRQPCASGRWWQDRRMISVYAYKGCDTCRKGLKWLNERGIPHEVKAIRETPPTVAELKAAVAAFGGDLRPLFNTSGGDYRELGLKDKLPGMMEDEAVALLSKNGNLVKRPFVSGDGVVLVGFKEGEWAAVLG